MPEKDMPTIEQAPKLSWDTKLDRCLAIAGSVVSMTWATLAYEATWSPDKAQAEKVCTETVEAVTCVYDPPNAPEQNPPVAAPDKPDKHPPADDGVLPLPERHNRRYWATKILNEILEGKDGRISASGKAKRNLKQARNGRCSPVEQIPDRCVKLDKTLLKVLYKTSQEKRFYIWHLTGGPHVPNSHHFDGDAADLRRFNGKAPWNKSLLPILRRHTPADKNVEMLGPGDNAAHTGRDDGHWHFAIF